MLLLNLIGQAMICAGYWQIGVYMFRLILVKNRISDRDGHCDWVKTECVSEEDILKNALFACGRALSENCNVIDGPFR